MRQAGMIMMVILVCTLSAHYGRRKRQSGQPMTARDFLLVMTAAWGFGWMVIGGSALFDWGQHVAWREVLYASLLLLGFALTPLALVAAAFWLPQLFKPDGPITKKPMNSHPLE